MTASRHQHKTPFATCSDQEHAYPADRENPLVWQYDRALDHINRMGCNCCPFSFQQDSFSQAFWQTIKALCKWCFRGEVWGTREIMGKIQHHPTHLFISGEGRNLLLLVHIDTTLVYTEEFYLHLVTPRTPQLWIAEAMLHLTLFFIVLFRKMRVYGIRFLTISFGPQVTCCWVVVFKFKPNSAKHFVA